MTSMKAQLMLREVLPFALSLALLGALALLLDALLHIYDAVWIGRYLGIVGTLLIICSFWYSLRKRKLVKSGNLTKLMHLHERMAWLGSLLVLVHAGIHFNAILGWLAVWAMLVNVVSGLTGKFLLERSRKRMALSRERLEQQGVSAEKLEEQLYWDSLTFDVVKKWRVVHIPITLAFAALAIGHIFSIFLFWGWK